MDGKSLHGVPVLLVSVRTAEQAEQLEAQMGARPSQLDRSHCHGGGREQGDSWHYCRTSVVPRMGRSMS
jgi:hypothetical protein